MHELTASGLERARKCPPSFTLPHAKTESDKANKGVVVHEYLAGALESGVDEPREIENEEVKELCEKIDVLAAYRIAAVGNHRGEGNIQVEAPFAYSPLTGGVKKLRGKGHRDYSGASVGDVCGTPDVVVVEEDAVIVTDWKTGRYPVTPPHRNLQLRFLGMVTAKFYGKSEASIRIALIDDEGEFSVSDDLLSREDLLDVEEEIKEILRLVKEAEEDVPVFNVGGHCSLCPAFNFCPAQAGAALSLLEGEDELDDRTAVLAWQRLRAVEAAAKKSREALATYVSDRGSITIPDGGELRIVESRREKIDARIAVPLLINRYGTKLGNAVSVQKTPLKKLAGKDYDILIKDLRELNAVETSTFESLREV